MKKIFSGRFSFVSGFLLVAAICVAGTFQSLNDAHAQAGSLPTGGGGAQTAAYSVTGYAWSDTIGWISFSGSTYGVFEDTAGNLTGYAWSDNIGWIKFGGLSGWPSGTGSNENALIDSGGTLHGWARACAGTINSADNSLSGDCSSMTSRTDGWDGWISLDGTGYGVNFASGNGQYNQNAYVWGSDVVGWINFNPLNLSNPPCDSTKEVCGGGPGLTASVNLYINPASVATGTAATLTWNTTNVTTCTESSTGSGGLGADSNWNGSMNSGTSTGSKQTSAFSTTGTETYSLTCRANSQAGGQLITSNYITLTVTGHISNPSGMCTSIPANATLCPNSSVGSGASTLVSSCPASSGSYICQYACSPNYHQVGNQCVSNGGVREQ